MKISSLFNCARAQSAESEIPLKAKAPLAFNLAQASNRPAQSDNADAMLKRTNMDKLRSSIRHSMLPKHNWERGEFRQLQQRIERWLTQLPESERRNVLVNQYTSWVNKHIDSNMEFFITHGGSKNAYKEAVLEAARKLCGSDGINAVGGPGFLSQQIKVQCDKVGLDYRSAAGERECDLMAKKIAMSFAKYLDIPSPRELERSMDRASQDYFEQISGKSHRPLIHHRDSIKLY